MCGKRTVTGQNQRDVAQPPRGAGAHRDVLRAAFGRHTSLLFPFTAGKVSIDFKGTTPTSPGDVRPLIGKTLRECCWGGWRDATLAVCQGSSRLMD